MSRKIAGGGGFRWLLTGTAAVIASLTGCSLAGLDDGLDQQTCSEAESCDCSDLNAVMPSGDACLTWRRGVDDLCELAARDLDNDFAPDEECAPEGVAPDCDDTNAAIHPMATEVCDRVDNNCDGVVDDAPFLLGQSTLLVPAAEASSVDFALDAQDGSLLVGYLDSREATGTPNIGRVSDIRSATTSSVVQTVEGDATTQLRSVGAQAIVIPIAGSEPEPTTIHSAPNVYAGFLDTNATRIRQDHFDAPFGTGGYPIARAIGKNAYVAFIERANRIPADDGCDIATGTQRAAVRVSSVQTRSMLTDRASRLEFPTAEALTLGQTSDPHRVGLLAIEGYGAVIAFADGDNIRVQALGPLSDAEPVVPSLLGEAFLVEVGSSKAGELFLALGPHTGDSVSLGLAYRTGCAAAARAEFVVLELNTTSNGFTASAPSAAIDDEEQRQPQMIYDDSQETWIAAWHASRQVVRAARLDPDGLNGSTSTALFAMACSAVDACLTERFYLWSLPTEIGVVGFLRGIEMPGFYSSSLSCPAAE